MLASGAHVKIGSKEFRLDTSSEGFYSHIQNTTGESVQFWLWDDWIGGEGNDAYDPLDEVVYHQGLVNPRVPGKLTTPPTRTSIGTAALTPVPRSAFIVAAGRKVWAVGEGITNDANSIWYWDTDSLSGSPTEVALNAWSSTNVLSTITDVVTDGSSLYICGFNDPAVTIGAGGVQVVKVDADDGADASFMDYSSALGSAIAGMKIGILAGYLYFWNGYRISEKKLDASAATNPKHILTTSRTNLISDTYGTEFWTDLVAGEDSLYFLFASDGQTIVYEKQVTGGVGEMWNLPAGFVGKCMAFQAGALLVAGEYLGQAAVYGMSVISRQPIFLGFVRFGSSVDLEFAGAGFGTEVLFAESALNGGGKLFVYDIGYDAFSQLDEVTHTSGVVGSVGVVADKRFAGVQDGSDITIYLWDNDDNQSTTVDGRMESGVWDMDLPEDEKQLDGIHVLSNAGTAGADYEVFYQDNEDGTWTSAGTATSGFHNYHQVSTASSTVKFRTLRLRVDPKDGCEIYAVSVRYRVNTYEESWELLLDLTDETVDEPRGDRRRSHQDRGHQLRDYIWDIADDKTVVTFLDGARYPAGDGDDPDKYTSHTVIVDVPVDRLTKIGEGHMLVRLRSVSTN